VTGPGRKYEEMESHPICVWNGILEAKHRERIGPAIWLYLELLDKITTEDENGIGWLLGRSPVKLGRFKGSRWMNRIYLERLAKFKYVVRKRTPYGFVIGVTNSRKLRFGRVGVTSNSLGGRVGVTSNSRVGITGTYKEDKAKEQSIEADKAARATAWEAVGINPLDRGIPPRLREQWEGLYATRNGQSVGELIGLCMDLWESAGNKIPRLFAKAAETVRGREKKGKPKTTPSLPELEPIPWRTK
jgi:hypothetical protein